MSAAPTEDAVVAAAASSPSVRIGPGQTRCCRLSAGCTSTDGASARCSGHGTSAAAATVATARAAAATNPAARPPMRSARFRSMRIAVSLRCARRSAIGCGPRAVLVVVVVGSSPPSSSTDAAGPASSVTDSACARCDVVARLTSIPPRARRHRPPRQPRPASRARRRRPPRRTRRPRRVRRPHRIRPPRLALVVLLAAPTGGRHLGAILRSRCAGRPGRRGDHPPSRGATRSTPVGLASGAGRDRQQERRADHDHLDRRDEAGEPASGVRGDLRGRGIRFGGRESPQGAEVGLAHRDEGGVAVERGARPRLGLNRLATLVGRRARAARTTPRTRASRPRGRTRSARRGCPRRSPAAPRRR